MLVKNKFWTFITEMDGATKKSHPHCPVPWNLFPAPLAGRNGAVWHRDSSISDLSHFFLCSEKWHIYVSQFAVCWRHMIASMSNKIYPLYFQIFEYGSKIIHLGWRGLNLMSYFNQNNTIQPIFFNLTYSVCYFHTIAARWGQSRGEWGRILAVTYVLSLLLLCTRALDWFSFISLSLFCRAFQRLHHYWLSL